MDLQNILLTTDFSDDSANALNYARGLAERFGSKLFVLHVIANPASSIYGPLAQDYASIVENARRRAREELVWYEQQLRSTPHELQIREGEIVKEILALAEAKAVDTIVIASHGLGDLRHFLLGSTAEKVLRTASCPVYVIRHQSRVAA